MHSGLATLHCVSALLQEKQGGQGRGRTQRLVDQKLRVLRMDANAQALLHERISNYTSQNHSAHTTLEGLAAESSISAGRGVHVACQTCSASTSRDHSALDCMNPGDSSTAAYQVRISSAARNQHAQTHDA